jgi:16S rRNA U1498 N3-methylase RsmE
MHLFFTPDLKQDDFRLPEEESRHCTKVLRLKEGDVVHLVDGRGTFYTARLSSFTGRQCQVEIIREEKVREPPNSVSLNLRPKGHIRKPAHFTPTSLPSEQAINRKTWIRPLLLNA